MTKMSMHPKMAINSPYERMQYTEEFSESQVFAYLNAPTIKIQTFESENQIVDTYGGLSDELAQMLPKNESSQIMKNQYEQPHFKNYEYNYTEQVEAKDQL